MGGGLGGIPLLRPEGATYNIYSNYIMEHYLVTIRAGALRYIPKEDIQAIYEQMKRTLKGYEWSDIYSYELDKERRWHFHTYVKGPRKPYLKGYSKNSLYVHFQEKACPNKNAIVRYITKESQDEDILQQQDWQSRAQYEYLFI